MRLRITSARLVENFVTGDGTVGIEKQEVHSPRSLEARIIWRPDGQLSGAVTVEIPHRSYGTAKCAQVGDDWRSIGAPCNFDIAFYRTIRIQEQHMDRASIRKIPRIAIG